MSPVLHAYPKPDVPREIAWQIRSYIRMQWPFLDPRDGSVWKRSPSADARTFVVLDGEALVSHAEANFREIEHAGERFKVGGVSAVFTYPAYRGGGFARAVVTAATEFLDRSDADLAMLFCGESLRRFYETIGWSAADEARIYRGERASPVLHEGNVVMMRFISDRARAAQYSFETHPIFVGATTW